MTEGPEATYLANYIKKHFRGKRLQQMKIKDGRYKRHGATKEMKLFSKDLPLKLLDVYKKGKVIFFLFEDNWCMIAKLGMVGWFSKPEDRPIFESEPNIIFQFENDDLFFFDFRNFGTLTFTQDPEKIYSQLNAIAPDIQDMSLTVNTVSDRISNMHIRTSMTLEEILMDQSLLISGIGNIIKSELLYDAKLKPARTLSSMTVADWKRLLVSARKIYNKILKNLENKGLDFKSYFNLHVVYQKEKDPDGLTVKSYKDPNGRTTFWVPAVQH